MSAPRQSLPFRFAHSSVELALRFWPEESRHWGHALAAELYEIEKPFEAIHWALGGLMLFTRATASRFLTWLKLPTGSRLSASSLPLGTSSPILPKRSRLFTAAVLAASVAVLFLPQSRVALSTVRATWQGFEIWDSDRGTLEKLVARAEKEKDARTLAFVALLTPESGRSMRLADQAVALDPTLTWIYASRYYRVDDDVPIPMHSEWLARLQSSDPDNAFIALTAADAISEPRYRAMIKHRTPAPGEFESAIVGDPQWVAQVENAFRAPRYDNYLRKHWELICYEWDRDPALSPTMIGYGLWSHRIPDLQSVKTFANLKFQRAQQALASGDPDQAASILQVVDRFAGRMLEQGDTSIERPFALELSRQTTQEFRNLYASTGRTREASEASARLQDIEKRRQAFLWQPYLVFPHSLRREALLFQTFAILLLVCGVMAALSSFLLEIRPRSAPPRRAAWQWILCRIADFAPASFLILSFAFLLSFLPIAQLFAHFRSASASIDTFREIRGTMYGLMQVPLSLYQILNPPFFWWLVTTALVILAAIFLFRLITRSKPAPQAAP